MINYKKISIIMPLYNVEKYVSISIESVINQNYDNLELIIVNDGSTDKSANIARSYEEKDKRIKLIHKENGGLSDARNTGINHATGDYIIFIDSDDKWESNSLKPLIEFIESNNLDVAIFGYSADVYDKDNNLISSTKVVEDEKIFDKSIDYQKILISNKQIIGYAWNKIYKTTMLRNNNIYFEKGISYIEDVLFNRTVYSFAKRIGFFEKSIYHYAQRKTETLGSKYYPGMALMDARANKAFYDSLVSLGCKLEDTIKYSNSNMINRSRWSAMIIATTNKINKSEKKKQIDLVAENLSGVKLNSNNILNNILLILFKYRFIEIIILIESIKTKKIIRYISDLMPINLKNCLLYISSKDQSYNYLNKNDEKIIITLAADYGNLGDIAITYAQKKFLSEKFKKHKIIILTVSDTYRKMKSLKSRINKNDIITIVGGGNMSDKYEDLEEQRRFIIRKFRKNKIISFPQTIDFSNSNTAKLSLEKSRKTYGSHKNLTILSRENRSFIEMKRLFNNKIALTPDIALSLDESKELQDRNKDKAIICIRQDSESSLSNAQKQNINKLVGQKYKEIEYRDTHIGDIRLTEDQSIKELENIWSAFRSSSLVITDRLHGMIFCAITKTPCIAINNSNGKVSGVYELWIKQLNGTVLIDRVDYDSIENALRKIDKKKPVSTFVLSNYFKDIKDIVS